MSPFMLGLLCAFVVGVTATAYFWFVRRRQDESAEGVLSLSAMRWREFAGLVAEMMFRRGYTASAQHPLGSGDQSDIVLKREDGLCVVSCKHGSAYRLGGNAIDEMANSVHMSDAAGGIIVTPGSFAPDVYEQARRERIELIDGKKLWPEIAPLVPEPMRARVEAHAAARAKRSIGFGWLAAVAVGAVVALLLPNGNGDVQAPPVSAVPAPAASTGAQKTAGPAAKAQEGELAPEQIEQRRKDAASAIAALPGIDRAVWSTQSTLSLDMGDERNDRWEGICDVLDSYEELRSTRVQINPPPGSSAPVRFRQCHAY